MFVCVRWERDRERRDKDKAEDEDEEDKMNWDTCKLNVKLW